jgi:hypothetical protein
VIFGLIGASTVVVIGFGVMMVSAFVPVRSPADLQPTQPIGRAAGSGRCEDAELACVVKNVSHAIRFTGFQSNHPRGTPPQDRRTVRSSEATLACER